MVTTLNNPSGFEGIDKISSKTSLFLDTTHNYISRAGHAVNNFLKTVDEIEKDFSNFIRQPETGEDFIFTYMEENY